MENTQLSPPDLATLLDAVKTSTKLTLNAVNVGIIQSFDATKQTATIKLAIRRVRDIAPDGTKTITEYPLLVSCPVMTLFGGGSFISMPITAGDTCIVLFNDRDMDNWLLTGGSVIPNTRRTHDITDAIAIVGIRDFQNSIAAYLTNGVRLQFASNSKIDLTNNAISSLAALFTHTGDLQINGNLTLTGNIYGDGSNDIKVNANIRQQSGRVMEAGNGATGTFNVVTVVKGIVTGGS